MKLSVRTFQLPLQHTFTISRHSISEIPSVIVELSDGKFSGYGEATANAYYNINTATLTSAIESVRDIIETMPAEIPEVFWERIHAKLYHNPFALCAIDNAYNDLYARQQSKKNYELWNYKIDNLPLSNYTIGIDSVPNMIAKMKEMPWPIYKIKLGTLNDVQIVTELRKHTDAVFRVDANCAWTVKETIENAKIFKELGVEFIEQPLSADNFKGHNEVFEKSVLPIIADESCITEADVQKCFGNFHGINIKLMKCGGVTPARRMIAEAKKLGLKTMVGCMTESTVGISMIAQLLPDLDYVDMDGALLLKHDIASGIKLLYGKTHFSEVNGTGVVLY